MNYAFSLRLIKHSISIFFKKIIDLQITEIKKKKRYFINF